MFNPPAPQTYPDHVEVHLLDGQVAELRPLRHDETAPLLAVFDGMSMLSRARRYLTGMPSLTPRMLRTLADVGRRDHVAWLATVDGEAVGVGRYVAVTDTLAEVAFEVVDRYHRRGIGGALVDAVATVAWANGFTSVTATVHPSNRASVKLVNRLGLRLHASDGLLEGEALLRLPDPARVDRAAVLQVAALASSGLNHTHGRSLCSTQ